MKISRKLIAILLLVAMVVSLAACKTIDQTRDEGVAPDVTEPTLENPTVTTSEKPKSDLPWENGGKAPSRYTWEEFQALSPAHQMKFKDSFGSIDSFDAWLQAALGTVDAASFPWEAEGAKQPSDYTFEEFYALTYAEQQAFINWFPTQLDYRLWLDEVSKLKVESDEAEGEAEKPAQVYPWEENGAKVPADYTWEEYKSLTNSQKQAFINWFESDEAYEDWLSSVTEVVIGDEVTVENDEVTVLQYPWDKAGAKQPMHYTLEEYYALSYDERQAFVNWFPTQADYRKWFDKVTGVDKGVLVEKYPWEIQGAKEPINYTLVEFYALTYDEQQAFIKWFPTYNDYMNWLENATGKVNTQIVYQPWELPGAKMPMDYTLEEFYALSYTQRQAFISWFPTQADYRAWFENATKVEEVIPEAKYPWEVEGAKQPADYTLEEYEELTDIQKQVFESTFGSVDAFDMWLQNAQNNVYLPWLNGGKQPSSYTLEEYNGLSSVQKIAFRDSFGSVEAYEAWLQSAQGNNAGNVYLPWENGGKSPLEYSYAEYQALLPEQQMAFQKAFGNIDDFDAWLYNAQNNVYLPWLNGGKQPADYTLDEYNALLPELQMAFQKAFGSIEAFDAWMQNAQDSIGENVFLPWENGGKQPYEYSYAEFEMLSPEQQMAFQKAFGNIDDFDAWLYNAQNNVYLPWLNGGKQPADYTLDEYNALLPELQMAFQKSFGSIEAFDAWMQNAQNSIYLPWLNGGKQPYEYTYAEFEMLPADLQMEFQKYFGSIEAFDAWMQNAQNSVYLPWLNGGKQPYEYTYAEFEMLPADLQMEFQRSFGSIEAFDAWLASQQLGE